MKKLRLRVRNDLRTYDSIRETGAGQGNDYTVVCLNLS